MRSIDTLAHLADGREVSDRLATSGGIRVSLRLTIHQPSMMVARNEQLKFKLSYINERRQKSC
jgi:hypothetical protein